LVRYVLFLVSNCKQQRCYQDQGVRDQDQTGRDQDQDQQGRDQDQDQDLTKSGLDRSRDQDQVSRYVRNVVV